MKLTALFALVVLFSISSCAQHEAREADVTVELSHLTLDLPGFLKFTRADLKAMTPLRKQSKTVPLSENRQATCLQNTCQLTSTNKADSTSIEFTREAVLKLNEVQARAIKTKTEERFVDGPVTVRCTAALCVADLFIKEDKPQTFKAKANVAGPDYTGELFQAFVRGLLGGS